jgi:hypothetical protein
MSNYCTTQIGHLELERTNVTKNWKIGQDFKIRRRIVVSFFWGKRGKDAKPTAHGTHYPLMLNLVNKT